MSLTGPSAHRLVTLAFSYLDSHGRGGSSLPSLEVRPPMPIPAVGDVVELPEARRSSPGFRVLERRYRYEDDARCTVTLVVTDAGEAELRPFKA